MSDIPQARRSGHWTEYLTSGVAVIVSLVSVWIGIGTEDANQRMVAAASWPFLQLDSGNVDDAGKQHIQLSLANAGVGPAKVETFEVLWHGRAYARSQELLNDCCHLKYFPFRVGTDIAFAGPQSSPPVGHVIRPGETRLFLGLMLSQANADAWRTFDRVRLKELTIRACYCSVFDECWISNLRDLYPKPVKACPAPQRAYSE